MKIKKITYSSGRDFSAVMICEHCENEQEIKTGYDDGNYHNNVIPTMTCLECDRDRSGYIPKNPNPSGGLSVGIYEEEKREALAAGTDLP